MNLYFSNPLINPSNSYDYNTYYINGDNTISMKSSLTYEAITISMEDYTISSDMSFFPWYSYKNQQGIVASDSIAETVTLNQKSYKSEFIFKKSPKSTSYTRNFLKIMDAFYFMVGSFAPTLVAFAFFIHPILSSIFQMRFATYIYRLE